MYRTGEKTNAPAPAEEETGALFFSLFLCARFPHEAL